MYRSETMWSDLADLQPEVDQHASLMLFLGTADRLFSQDYGDLVSKNKRLWELQSKRDQFMSMLDQVSKDLVGADELGVALTSESIAGAQDKLAQEATAIEARRGNLLQSIRISTEKHLNEQNVGAPDIGDVSQRLVDLQAQQEQVGGAIRHTEARIAELTTIKQLLEDEVSKLARAQEAGAVLADLRVTHCPACDQHLEKSVDDHSCYVCGRPLSGHQDPMTASRRIEFESEQLHSELAETNQLLVELREELEAKNVLRRDLVEQIGELNTVLRPIRQAAAALLPPELFLLDVTYGRVHEKGQQLGRIKAVLDQREQLAADIHEVQEEIGEIETAVDGKTGQVDFESLGDRLRDGMITYFNRIVHLNPKSWLGNPVSVRFGERSFRFKVGESGWKAKLGGTQRLYFLFAYHYALLNLSKYPDTLYPGFLMIDFPASLEDRAAIADNENFILVPFVELLQKKEMAGCQMIAAGRSFKGLKNVHVIEFDEVWK
jgi:hypothetical protein